MVARRLEADAAAPGQVHLKAGDRLREQDAVDKSHAISLVALLMAHEMHGRLPTNAPPFCPRTLPLAHEMRHHGDMAGECIHGFAPGTCLICQTLDKPKVATGKRSRTEVEPVSGAPVEPHSGPRVVPKEAPRTGSHVKMAGVVIAVIVVFAAAWVALHLVFAVLHIVELIGVALIAGYVSWLAGVRHGRRGAAS